MSNNLSLAEIERLAVLAEELGEVQQMVGKILRFGYESKNPSDLDGKTNRELLETELGDLTLIINHCHTTEDINLLNVMSYSEKKKPKLNKYFIHNKIEL